MTQIEQKLLDILPRIYDLCSDNNCCDQNNINKISQLSIEAGSALSNAIGEEDFDFSQEFRNQIANAPFLSHMILGYLSTTMQFCREHGVTEGIGKNKDDEDPILNKLLRGVSNDMLENKSFSTGSLENILRLYKHLIEKGDRHEQVIRDCSTFEHMSPRVRYSMVLAFVKTFMMFVWKEGNKQGAFESMPDDLRQLIKEIMDDLNS